MKKLLFLALLAMVFILAAFSANGDAQSNEKSTEVNITASSDLTSGLDKVLTSLDELKTTIETSPNDVEKIHSTGKTVEEDWDQIEKQVEKINPKEYNNIESSLYPLIHEVKKDEPNVVKAKQLIDETIPKVESFKEAQ